MAVEARRGCGYRKAGGLYLVASGMGSPCHRLPIPLIRTFGGLTVAERAITQPHNEEPKDG